MTQLAASPRTRRPSGAPYADWTRVADDTGALSLDVPAEWSNVWGDGWHAQGFADFDGKRIGPGLNASPNISYWRTDGSVPGVFVGVGSRPFLARYSPRAAARRLSFEGATTICSGDISFGVYEGSFVEWESPTPLHNWICVGAQQRDATHLLFVQVKLVRDRDVQALDRILESIEVVSCAATAPPRYC